MKLIALVLILIAHRACSFTINMDSTKKIDDVNKLLKMKLFDELESEIKKKDEITCFTCDKSFSNDECNRNAIDEPCRHSTASGNNTDTLVSNKAFACMTIHRYNTLSSKTVSIEKRCALDCTPDMVGCVTADSNQNIRTCTYCCNKNYCNMDAAKNTNEALKLGESLLIKNDAICVKKNFFLAFSLLFISLNF